MRLESANQQVRSSGQRTDSDARSIACNDFFASRVAGCCARLPSVAYQHVKSDVM